MARGARTQVWFVGGSLVEAVDILATEELTETRTGWWQLKYLLFFSPIWGRLPF